jgi:acetyl-CoA C-acetyltransferase
MKKEVVIASATRTPIGRFLGGISPIPAPELGAIAIREAVNRAGIKPEEVEEVLMGNVCGAGVGQAPARQSSIKAGIPGEVGATTINKVCASRVKAVVFAAQAIQAEDADIIVAGGMESMSNVPHYLKTGRSGQKLGDQSLVDGVVSDGLWCSFEDQHMGNIAEFTASNSKITREEQDEYAFKSHQKAVKAIQDCKFQSETIAVEIPVKRGDNIVVEKDESPRADTSIEKLSTLRPAFVKEGTVTAGNAPGLNDGASALVVMSGDKAKKLGNKPLARITGYATGGGEPKMLFYAPIVAVKKLLQKLDYTIDDFDLIEINEAFSVQALADGKELGWNWDKVNVNGGAVALGHPIGASGARILTTLIYALKERNQKKGLATLCLGGGNAVALSVEMV